MELFQKKIDGISTSFQLAKAKLELDAVTTKNEIDTLSVKYKMGEEQVKALIAKHRMWLNQKVEQALAPRWNEWSTQAAKLKIS